VLVLINRIKLFLRYMQLFLNHKDHKVFHKGHKVFSVSFVHPLCTLRLKLLFALFLLIMLLSGCGIRMDAIQAFEQPMFENGGYNYGQIFYIFEDDISFVRVTDYRNGAYRISLYGKEGWITRRYPYYKPDWQKWQQFARKLKEFEKALKYAESAGK